jgi:hypothetical protein
MTNPLTSAYAAEKANRSGTTSPDPTSAANPTADADLNEARGSALANALTGATKADVQPQPTVSDQRKCDHCGALEPFCLEGNDDGSDFEDRKKAAVNAAVAKVRAEHAIDEVNSKVNRAINAAVLEERKRIIEVSSCGERTEERDPQSSRQINFFHFPWDFGLASRE